MTMTSVSYLLLAWGYILVVALAYSALMAWFEGWYGVRVRVKR